jgi:hypothetical protein
MLNKAHLRRMTDNFRRLLTCADDGGRVIILRRTCRMPLDGSVYGYLNPIRCSRLGWGVCPLGLGGCEVTHLGTLMYPKTTSAALSGNMERNLRVSYTLEDPEAKFTRDRCIRVAAMIIMI